MMGCPFIAAARNNMTFTARGSDRVMTLNDLYLVPLFTTTDAHPSLISMLMELKAQISELEAEGMEKYAYLVAQQKALLQVKFDCVQMTLDERMSTAEADAIKRQHTSKMYAIEVEIARRQYEELTDSELLDQRYGSEDPDAEDPTEDQSAADATDGYEGSGHAH